MTVAAAWPAVGAAASPRSRRQLHSALQREHIRRAFDRQAYPTAPTWSWNLVIAERATRLRSRPEIDRLVKAGCLSCPPHRVPSRSPGPSPLSSCLPLPGPAGSGRGKQQVSAAGDQGLAGIRSGPKVQRLKVIVHLVIAARAAARGSSV